jgi:hypothetical protein
MHHPNNSTTSSIPFRYAPFNETFAATTKKTSALLFLPSFRPYHLTLSSTPSFPP